MNNSRTALRVRSSEDGLIESKISTFVTDGHDFRYNDILLAERRFQVVVHMDDLKQRLNSSPEAGATHLRGVSRQMNAQITSPLAAC